MLNILAPCSAANLVGRNVLQLMTDAAASELSFPMPIQHQSCRNIPDILTACSRAAALNYGLFRQASFNATPQYIMFYDVGALSTTASIIGEYIIVAGVLTPLDALVAFW